MSFLDYEGTDPVSSAKEAAANLTAAKDELKDQGVRNFLFRASSEEEFDQRAEMRGVPEAVTEAADKYLGPRVDRHAHLMDSMKREFVLATSESCPNCNESMSKFKLVDHVKDCKGSDKQKAAAKDDDYVKRPIGPDDYAGDVSAGDAARAAVPHSKPVGVTMTDWLKKKKDKSSDEDADDE